MLPFLWDLPDLELVNKYFLVTRRKCTSYSISSCFLVSSHRHHTGIEITSSQTEKCPVNTQDPMRNTVSLGNNQ